MRSGGALKGHGLTGDRPFLIRLLHWIVAALAIIAFAGGLMITDTGWNGAGFPDRDLLYAAHKSAGMLVIICLVIWAAARIFAKGRQRPGLLALMHITLALLLFTVALLGWAGNSAGRFGLEILGFIPAPEIIPARDPALAIQLYDLHMMLANIALFAIGIHIAGALFHLIILRDGRFSAMLFRRK